MSPGYQEVGRLPAEEPGLGLPGEVAPGEALGEVGGPGGRQEDGDHPEGAGLARRLEEVLGGGRDQALEKERERTEVYWKCVEIVWKKKTTLERAAC